MARDFYPMVEKKENGDEDAEGGALLTNPARIAVYDDAAAAPRVVVVEPKDVRAYLEEITGTVNKLSHEQGGSIPFMVIREIVENFIHAYFQSPTITILDGGNTIRFSDQGPGIREKDLALEYGTSSATEDMRRYIRGVGSGLPYAQQYMEDKGGSLTIEDNIAGGTVVTISIRPKVEAAEVSRSPQAADHQQEAQGFAQQGMYQQPVYAQQPGWPAQAGAWPQQGMYQPQPFPQVPPYMQQGFQQTGYPQPGYAQPGFQQPGFQQAQQPYQQPVAPAAPAQPQVTERGSMVISYLSQHESCGPTELVREYGFSGPTWSRELGALVAAGYVMKDGQKHRLTGLGRQLASTW